MELIVIAFLGTLALMAAELRDFMRRGRGALGAEPWSVGASGPSHRTGSQPAAPAVPPADDLYDAAA